MKKGFKVLRSGMHFLIQLLLISTVVELTHAAASKSGHRGLSTAGPGFPALPNNGLRFNFYGATCPQAENVVRNMVQGFIMNDFTIAPALIRLHFHDCSASNGCDGSILLNSVDGGKTPPEKASPANIGLRGFDLVEEIKSELERECPGIVSCADILALIARDATATIGGPFWFEPLGRRDGFVSKISDMVTMPAPYDRLGTLLQKFAAMNLNLVDLVALSGVHTIGRAHCESFNRRLSNFHRTHKPDPTLKPAYANQLRRQCSPRNNTAVLVPNNPFSIGIFDNQYYLNLLAGKVLFTSDEELLSNRRARVLIEQFANDQFAFFNQFSTSIINLGNAKVLTGRKGNIRKVCSRVH
ncbi:hypothetical protein O6H91_09G016600 [Diphasiastrum complanatum]|uniref:Uncharacterized protein n=1 Tax=Diphasiastrum complanatum TaxID=34168 RepID=A0ACC2CLR5_DIPCM|nr:hypothetical protein O6H91_09G016600 [Diphasiastrum complanatum]